MSAHLYICVSVFWGGKGRGDDRAFSSNSRSPLSPGKCSHRPAGLSLGRRGTAAARSGSQLRGDQRPWRRLCALRLPRLCLGFTLQRLTRMLNPSCPTPEKSRNPSFLPSDLDLCLRCPLPWFRPSAYLSFLSPTLEYKVFECSLLDHGRPVPSVGIGWTLCHWEAWHLFSLDPAPFPSELPHPLLFLGLLLCNKKLCSSWSLPAVWA